MNKSHIDVECQTSKKLSANSPRKLKQRKVIDCQRKRLKRLRQSLNAKQKRKPAKIQKDEVMTMLKGMLPEYIINFIDSQIDLHRKKPKGKRYSNETRRFALSLYHISGKAYRLLAKIFSPFHQKQASLSGFQVCQDALVYHKEQWMHSRQKSP